jgi:hypothetical protein
VISPLDDARMAMSHSEDAHGDAVPNLLSDALRALIQHGAELELRLERMEARLARLEEPDRPPSGLKPLMGAEE